MSPATPQAGMGSHYPQVPGSHPEQGGHRCWQEGILPGLTFVACGLLSSSSAPRLCTRAAIVCVCMFWVWLAVRVGSCHLLSDSLKPCTS